MGDLRIFNSAGTDDNPNTVTSTGSAYGRVEDLFATKEEISGIIQNSENISLNSANIQDVLSGAPAEMDSFKEVADEIGPEAMQDFLDALNGT